MNKLLKLGLQAQSVPLVGKHLRKLLTSDAEFISIIDYCVKNKKIKIIQYVLNEKSADALHHLSLETGESIKQLCIEVESLKKFLPLFEKKNEGLNLNSNSVHFEEDDFSTGFGEWEVEEVSIFDGNDSDIKKNLQVQDIIVTTTEVSSYESNIFDFIDVTLPVIHHRHVLVSLFIKNNKDLLMKYYFNLFNDDITTELIIKDKLILFDEFDTEELNKAILLSLNDISSLPEINFGADIKDEGIIFVENSCCRFEEWLESLDNFLEEWKRPKLSNPVFKNYFNSLGSSECKPISKEEELEILGYLQKLVGEMLFWDLDSFINIVCDNFNEKFENPYIVLDEVQIEFLKYNQNMKNSISIWLNEKEVFIRPVSTLEYFRKLNLDGVSRLLNKIQLLINKFQLANLRLVVYEAKKYQKNFIDYYFDFIQEGNLGLLAAINRFDPKKGNKFSTYATWWIKQHIARYKDTIYSEVRVPIHYMERVNQLNKILREDFINPTTDELPLSYLKNVSERSEINIEDLNKILEKSLWKRDFQFDIDPLLYDSEDESSETKIFVNFLMENTALKEKEREIIEKRFGINLSQSMTLEEIGQEFDVTRERIRQIESKAIKKLCVKYKSIVGLETLTQSSNLGIK